VTRHHLKETAEQGNLRLFIVDRDGVDVLRNANKEYGDHRTTRKLYDYLQRLVIGASRRPLRETFGGDTAEQGKVMRFFESA